MEKCTTIMLIFVVCLVWCILIFSKAVYIPGPDTMEVTVDACFSQNIQNSYYHQDEREIYGVWNVVYELHDDTLLVEILANSTPPDELKYMDVDSTDKWLCEVQIKSSRSSDELRMSALTEGYAIFGTNPDQIYEISISENGRFYEIEFPILILLEKPQDITFTMKFDVGKIKRSFDITVDTQAHHARGIEDYTIELHLPKDYQWNYLSSKKSEKQPQIQGTENERYGIFRNHGNGIINAGTVKPLNLNWAVIFSMAMFFLGILIGELFRCFSDKKRDINKVDKKRDINKVVIFNSSKRLILSSL